PHGIRLDINRAAPRRGLRIGGRRPLDASSGHRLRSAAAWPQEETEEEVKAQRVFRPNRKTVEERARERSLRERLQKEKPSIEDLVESGACDLDAVMTM